MNIPDIEVKKLIFGSSPDLYNLNQMVSVGYQLDGIGAFADIHWLNTPGPIYTTYTDNCGTGPIEAINNVGGDEDYHEVIFRQPVNTQQLKETITAAVIDPFDAYYWDGNLNWNEDNIGDWWGGSEARVNYVIVGYKNELELANKMSEALPLNYKHWLDFYQYGLKEYLEWYVYKLQNKTISLPPFKYDWTQKSEYDELYKIQFEGK